MLSRLKIYWLNLLRENYSLYTSGNSELLHGPSLAHNKCFSRVYPQPSLASLIHKGKLGSLSFSIFSASASQACGSSWAGFFLPLGSCHSLPLPRSPCAAMHWSRSLSISRDASTRVCWCAQRKCTLLKAAYGSCRIWNTSLTWTKRRVRLCSYFSLMSWYWSLYNFLFGNNSVYITHIFCISTLSFFTIKDTCLETESVFFFQVFIFSGCLFPTWVYHIWLLCHRVLHSFILHYIISICLPIYLFSYLYTHMNT